MSGTQAGDRSCARPCGNATPWPRLSQASYQSRTPRRTPAATDVVRFATAGSDVTWIGPCRAVPTGLAPGPFTLAPDRAARRPPRSVDAEPSLPWNTRSLEPDGRVLGGFSSPESSGRRKSFRNHPGQTSSWENLVVPLRGARLWHSEGSATGCLAMGPISAIKASQSEPIRSCRPAASRASRSSKKFSRLRNCRSTRCTLRSLRKGAAKWSIWRDCRRLG